MSEYPIEELSDNEDDGTMPDNVASLADEWDQSTGMPTCACGQSEHEPFLQPNDHATHCPVYSPVSVGQPNGEDAWNLREIVVAVPVSAGISDEAARRNLIFSLGSFWREHEGKTMWQAEKLARQAVNFVLDELAAGVSGNPASDEIHEHQWKLHWPDAAHETCLTCRLVRVSGNPEAGA